VVWCTCDFEELVWCKYE